jgi:hypothetical protein
MVINESKVTAAFLASCVGPHYGFSNWRSCGEDLLFLPQRVFAFLDPPNKLTDRFHGEDSLLTSRAFRFYFSI